MEFLAELNHDKMKDDQFVVMINEYINTRLNKMDFESPNIQEILKKLNLTKKFFNIK